MAKKMWMKLLKKWGEYKVGEEAMFDQSKAVSLMAQGVLEKAKPPQKPKRLSPKVETAVAPQLNVEKAVVTPKAEDKSDVKDESEADTQQKAVPLTEDKSRSRFGKGKRG